MALSLKSIHTIFNCTDKYHTELHRSVLENDPDKLNWLVTNTAFIHPRNQFGWTPLDLAEFLGHTECQNILQGPTQRLLRVKLAHNSAQIFNEEDLHHHFGLTYTRTLRFSTYQDLLRVASLCPLSLKYFSWGRAHRVLGERIRRTPYERPIPVSIRWVDEEIQYGLFADEEFPAGFLLGIYAGYVCFDQSSTSEYCFDYPTRIRSSYKLKINARNIGNELRFINHSNTPNVAALYAVDRSIIYAAFLTRRIVCRNEQLLLDYGRQYWDYREKCNL